MTFLRPKQTNATESRTRRIVLRVLVALGLLVAVYSTLIEPGLLVTREVSIDVAWPHPSAPVRIAVVSDLHIGAPFINRAKVQTIVDRINAGHPDVIVIVGDFVEGVLFGTEIVPEDFAPWLGTLRAPSGVFAVLGNHDGWYGATRVRRALEANGIVVLVDEAKRTTVGGEPLWIVGYEDKTTGHPNVEIPLEKIPEGERILALEHEPDVFVTLPKRVPLMLAGHTHGGQVLLPFIGSPIVPSRFGQRFRAGVVENGEQRMFVTTGVGTSGYAVRFGVVPEIVFLTVRGR